MKASDSENPIMANPLHDGISSYAFGGTLSGPLPLDAAALREFGRELMTSIASRCIRAGAVDVGHVKSMIQHETGFLYADVVGEPGNVSVEGRDGDATNRFRITLNAVIFGIPRTDVERATEESLQDLCARFQLSRDAGDFVDSSVFEGEGI